MNDERASVTAAWVAAMRTGGALLPPEYRLADDPYGAALAGSRAIERLADTRLGRALATRRGLGTFIAYMQVRTRVLDDFAREIAKKPGAQLVVLGAGYDCRAIRLPELAHVPVFEVDHPATQRRKQRVLGRMGVTSPAHYVTWDFEARPLAELPEQLARAGLDRSAPVLTIWEGVTMYLTEGAIDASLRAIRAWSGPGSQLAMTYFERTRIAHPSPILKLMRATVKQLGEPFIWGWQADEVAPYLAPRGWRVIENRSLDDAANELWPPALARNVQARGSRYALAEVT
ncbi:MAG: SAM-dependent methyltransferase [Deltaproteobacteria bacterium]